VDREDVINMAIDAGLDCYANNANKKMNEPLDEMESNYVNKLALFASFVYQYAYVKRDHEALTKNIVAMWPHETWVGLTDEEVAELSAYVYAGDPQYVRLIETKLKEKNT
jgi:hypothetical protein